ncbi:glycosyl transferase group 1 [Leptolyngbya sp. NIES-3755]|nr:glycosyl transferase group 1 [Leptolyngbya sp. NIES-3755]
MKVLIVIPAVGLVYGGTSKLVLELAKALGDRNLQIDVITTNANGSTNLEVPLHTWQQKDTYRIQYFPRWRLSEYKFSYSLTTWLFQHIREYDLVHTISLFTYPIAIAHWLCQCYRIPYVINPQGMLEPWALEYKGLKKKLYYTLIERPSLRKASVIQMLSQAEAEGIQPLLLPTPLMIVPNGVDRQDFESLPDAELFYRRFPALRGKTLILFLGRIDPKKGLDLLAPAFAQVHAQFPHTHLVVAGPDNTGFLPTAQSYFEQAGCLEATTFAGMLTGELKYAAFAAVHLYVAPSYSEGFSLSVLEGMASGLPCIFTTGCNFPEAAIANAADVVEIDADAIAKAMQLRLANRDSADALGQRAHEFILQHYTWDQIASKLHQIYNNILQPSPPLSSQSQ